MSKTVGKVVFIKDFATAKVEVEKTSVHKKYKKVTRSKKYFLCGINDKDIKVNDFVEITSCRPISKLKSHEIINVILKNA